MATEYPIRVKRQPLQPHEVAKFEARLWSRLTGEIPLYITNFFSMYNTLYKDHLTENRPAPRSMMDALSSDDSVGDSFILALFAHTEFANYNVIDQVMDFCGLYLPPTKLESDAECKLFMLYYIAAADPEFGEQLQAHINRAKSVFTEEQAEEEEDS